MLTRTAFRCLALATLASLATTAWVGDASALTAVSSCGQPLSKAGETYYLTADLTASGPCLIVAADRVTIDFKGHSITGDGTGAGVTDGGVARLLTAVKNGSADSFETGIDLAASSRSEVRGMSANYNTGNGITLGTRGLVKSCMVGYNGGDGVRVGSFSQVQECVAYSNSGDGIKAGDNSLINRNLAQSNANGITVGKFGTVTFSLAGNNAGHGIHANASSQVNGNSAAENAGVGIWIVCPATVARNESWDNDPNYSKMDGCRASGNQ